MSEEDKSPFEKHPVVLSVVLLLMIFGVVYGGAVFFGYIPNVLTVLIDPVVAIPIVITFILVVGIGGVWWLKSSGKIGGVERADQLTKSEADRLAERWHRNRGLLARSVPLDGVDYVESGNDSDENYARIYEKVIEPKLDANRKCILINLEQSVAVDVDDTVSLDEAIGKLNDAVFFSEDAVDNFDEARKEYKNNLAGSRPGETEIVHRPDGTKVRRNVQERTISEASDQNQDDKVAQGN